MVSPEVILLERRQRQISAGITTGLMAIFLTFSLVWKGCIDSSVPEEGIGNGEYEMVGAIDFGDGRMGSRDINNFQEAAQNPTAANAPVRDNTPAPKPQPQSEQLTQTDPSPVSEPAKPQQTPSHTTPQPTAPQPQAQPAQGGPSGGSNHGDASSGTGNAGIASAEKLDPNGLYSFSEGGTGGLQGRKALSLEPPRKIATNETGVLHFEFTVEADGTVSYVKMATLTRYAELRKIGEEAIYKWRFTPGGRQTVRVKITFK